LIRVTPRPDDRRVADTSGNFPSKTARCGTAGNFAMLIESSTVDCSCRRGDHISNRFPTEIRRNANIRCNTLHAPNAQLPVICMSGVAEAFAPIRTGNSATPPIGMGFFPKQPFFAGFVREKVFARKSLSDGKALGTFADEHNVPGVHSHC